MALQGWLQIALTLLIALLISIPVGRYLAKIFTDQRTLVDPLFDPIDNFIYRLIGRKVVDPTDELEAVHGSHVGDQHDHDRVSFS